MTTKNHKQMNGTVLKRSGDKTVAVVISRVEQHPVYGKRQVRNKKYLVHDPHNTAKVGDVVVIQETRPLSARKRWIIVAA